jgi:acetolactate synthase I/II/III large subunit
LNAPAKRMAGEMLADLLVQYGITHVFGMPGETSALYKGMYRWDSGASRHILLHDERNAPYAAMAVTRMTGRIAAIDAPPGVGSVMMTAGLAEAYGMSMPILALITEVTSKVGPRSDRGAHAQSMDQIAMLKPMLKYSAVAPSAASIPELLRYALLQATSGRPGPVALFLPSDVLEQDASEIVPGPVEPQLACVPSVRSAPDPKSLELAAEMLLDARRPVLLVGGGAMISGAGDAIVRLAEQLQIPVATTLTGSGVIDEHHPLSVGVPGYWGIDCAGETLQAADLIFTIGAKSGQNSTLSWRVPSDSQRAIHLDIDATEPGKLVANTVRLVGDARVGIESLSNVIGDKRGSQASSWLEEVRRLKEIWRRWVETQAGAPRPCGTISVTRIMLELERRLQAGDVLACDASSPAGWGTYLRLKHGASRLCMRGIATLGSSLGAAMGAKLARPDATVVQLTGDAGVAYYLGELATVRKYGLKLITVVINNRRLGALRVCGLGFPDEAQVQGEIDVAKVAEACGWTGIDLVGSTDDLSAALDRAFAATGPVLVNIPTDPDESPGPLNRVHPIAEERQREAARATPCAGQ